MAVMLALVSDQRMQNVIPLLDLETKYKQLVLILSKERHGKPHPKYFQSAESIKLALPHIEVTIHDNYVDPYDIQQVFECVSQVLELYSQKHEVVLNISGGTKPMAIGALQAAQKMGIASLYTNTDNNELIWLEASSSIHREPMKARLKVGTYLKAYGSEIASSVSIEKVDQRYKLWATTLTQVYDLLYKSVILKIMEVFRSNREEFLVIPITTATKRQRAQLTVLADQDLWQFNSSDLTISLPREHAQFLNGNWLEIAVACQLQTTNIFDDIQLNVKIQKRDEEIDVMAVANGRLILVECKSNLKATDLFGKLKSLRDTLGGTFALVYYVRADDSYEKQISKSARDYQLTDVIMGTQIAHIGQKIKTRLNG